MLPRTSDRDRSDSNLQPGGWSGIFGSVPTGNVDAGTRLGILSITSRCRRRRESATPSSTIFTSVRPVFRAEDLTSYFLTEDDGRVLQASFPGSERLRYTIPFRPAVETIDCLLPRSRRAITRRRADIRR